MVKVPTDFMRGVGHLTGQQPAIITLAEEQTSGSDGLLSRELIFNAPVLVNRITIRVHSTKISGVGSVGIPTIVIFKRGIETDRLEWNISVENIGADTGQEVVYFSDLDTREFFGENETIQVTYKVKNFAAGTMYTVKWNISVIGLFV